MLANAFNIILYRPLLNILILLYKYLPGHDFGVAVIILTILIKLLLYPLGNKAIKSQKALLTLQPKIKEIQEKYKDNKEEQAKALMALYKKEKISPFSGFLPLLIQLPVLIALYRVFWHGLQPEAGIINPTFFGIINLSQPNIIMALLAGIFQFIQTKMSIPKQKNRKQDSGLADQMQKQMQYFMPAFMVIILLRLPSAIGLYWITTTLFTIIQQYFIITRSKKYDYRR